MKSLVLLLSIVLGAQAPAAPAAPTFEVASVKPNNSGGARGGRLEPGAFSQTNVTLRQLIRLAYPVREMSGGPGWLDADKFDVVAKGDFDLSGYLPGPNGAPPIAYAMLRNLLAERFKLAAHVESRDAAIFALVKARADGVLGAHLKKSDVDCAAVTDALLKSGKPPAPVAPGQGPPCSQAVAPGRVRGTAISLSQLAGALTTLTDRAVQDRTNLAGVYDVDLQWTPEDAPADPFASSGPPEDAVSLFTAIQEQLGLKLDATRGPIDVLVIDRAEKPTPD